ncbi:MAG: hypothetical protein KC897_03785 [Candidatus Omnitrophica bacterium]|nr:hypothetical protein [Candidatus Omnitrophota bacterium]MCB9721680.1 hypothetical protein [Candidatus Omnitrophota bacterium]
MRDTDFFHMQWDNAQHCPKCNKHFMVQGAAAHKKCPDCGGALSAISTEQADRIERMMGLFQKTAGFLGMDRRVTETFQAMIRQKAGGLYKCDACGELTPGTEPDGAQPGDGCRACHGPLREANPGEVNAEALLKLPQSETREFTAKSLTEHHAFCPVCGKTTRDTVRPAFCSHCGANLSGRQAKVNSGLWLYYLMLALVAAGAIAGMVYFTR